MGTSTSMPVNTENTIEASTSTPAQSASQSSISEDVQHWVKYEAYMKDKSTLSASVAILIVDRNIGPKSRAPHVLWARLMLTEDDLLKAQERINRKLPDITRWVTLLEKDRMTTHLDRHQPNKLRSHRNLSWEKVEMKSHIESYQSALRSLEAINNRETTQAALLTQLSWHPAVEATDSWSPSQIDLYLWLDPWCTSYNDWSLLKRGLQDNVVFHSRRIKGIAKDYVYKKALATIPGATRKRLEQELMRHATFVWSLLDERTKKRINGRFKAGWKRGDTGTVWYQGEYWYS